MHIQSLTLFTDKVAELHDFYADTMGFPVVDSNPEKLVFRAGSTTVTFLQKDGFEGIYHVAFDIPQNRADEAQVWLEQRVPLLSDGERTRFEMVDGWNSSNLYFDDPVGNIMEFTARHDLQNDSDESFDAKSVLYVSELGVVVPDMTQAVEKYGRDFGLHPFNGQSDVFTALGGHDGMLIVVKEGRGWIPVGRPAKPTPFELTFRNGEKPPESIQQGIGNGP